jgi:KDO2-lipid IV(A) lauroyltransferase
VIVRGPGLRRFAYVGARYFPRLWVAHSPTFFGALFAALLPAERARIRASLRLLFGARASTVEQRDILGTFVNYAHCLAESLGAERPDALARRPTVRGTEHFARASEEGRGVVIVTAHTGAWDVAARLLTQDFAVSVLLVMAAEPDASARALQDEIRARLGVKVAHVGAHALDALPVLRHLRRGGVAAMQLDRVARAETALQVLVGGAAFAVPAGPFHLARLARAPVVPVFTRRTGYFDYQIEILPPIAVGDGPSGVEAAAREATTVMADFLRQNPTQWFHFAESPGHAVGK